MGVVASVSGGVVLVLVISARHARIEKSCLPVRDVGGKISPLRPSAEMTVDGRSSGMTVKERAFLVISTE